MTQIKLCRLHVNATHDVRFQSSKDSAHFLLFAMRTINKTKKYIKNCGNKVRGSTAKNKFQQVL